MVNASLSMLYDFIRFEEKSIIEAARRKGVKLVPIDAKKIHLDVTGQALDYDFGDVALQRCVSYFRALHLACSLEHLGVLVMNPFKVLLTCGNKLLTTLALNKAGIPTPKTMIAFTPEAVMDLLEKRGYGAVLKPVIGSWGRFVAPLKDRESAEAILESREYMHPLYHVYYVQEMVRRPPRDIRVTVIGDKAVAAIYRIAAPGMWKTSIARGGKAKYCRITSELEEISLRSAEAVGRGILGIDLMESDEGYLVHEVNSTIEFAATVATTNVDIPGLIIDYAIEKVKK